MNRDQHVMEPCCDFIDRVGLVIEPVLHVGEKVLRALRHGLPRNADVLHALAELARPLPRTREHSPVQFSKEARVDHGGGRSPCCQPLLGVEDICLFPGVELSTSGDMSRYQFCGLVRIEGRGAVGQGFVWSEVGFRFVESHR